MFRFLRRLRARVKYRHFERDLAEEIETHRVLRQADLVNSGLSPEDARATSYRDLGNVRVAREDARAIWIARWLDSARQDLRYALRGLRRRPGFALTAISILGLSTGLLSAVVLFADSTLLRPWRVPQPERVGLIRSTVNTADGLGVMRIAEYSEIHTRLKAWTGIALVLRGDPSTLTFEDGAMETVGTLAITPNYFDTLALPIHLGRTFDSREADPLLPQRVVIISYRLWQTRLHGDPGAIGASVRLGSDAYTIVGVAPEGFLDGIDSRNEAWLPFSLELADTAEKRRAYLDPHHRLPPNLMVIGRIGPGYSREQALAELRQTSATYRTANRVDDSRFGLTDTRPFSLGFARADWVGALELATMALVLVQLLACANVGNLMLAGAMMRRQEIAVRFAIGAGRARVLRQLLTEAAVLVVLAAALGFTTAMLLPRVLLSALPAWVRQRPEFYAPGQATYLMLGAVIVVSTLIVAVAPALRSANAGLATIASDRHGNTRGGAFLRRVLLGAQIALATVLLSGAALLTRGVSRAMALDTGFPIHEFQDVELSLPFRAKPTDGVVIFSSDTAAGQQRQAFFRELFAEMQEPGWPPNAFANVLPIDANDSSGLLARVIDSGGVQDLIVKRRDVSPNYFQTLGVPLSRGRMPSPASDGREVVLNESAARLLFPNADPVGKSFNTLDGPHVLKPVAVVGLVRDLPITSLVDTAPTAYAAASWMFGHLLVRSLDPTVASRVTSIARRLDPDTTVAAYPLSDSVATTLDNARMGGLAAWAISAIGLILATIGAFGVFACAVEERRREVGIRMALGARGSQVVAFVLKSSQGTMLAGLAGGVSITLALSPVLHAYLYGLSAFDPITYLEVAAILAAAGTLATWIPARRATRINPVEALRAD
jgi:putative ABC transport system permease protein